MATGAADHDRKGIEFIGKPYRRTELARKVRAALSQAA
jgi:hypothetical protein